MRRKPYLSLLLAVILLGGMLALFPTVWMALLIVLLALLAVQVTLVRRNLYRLPAGHTQVEVPFPRGGVPVAPAGEAPHTAAPPAGDAAAAPDAPPGAGPSEAVPATGQPAAAEPAPEPAPTSGPNIDTELFSRFRRHLERAESDATDAAPAPAPEPPDAGEVQDRVEISRSARRPAGAKAPRAKPSSPEPAAEAEPEGPDLFADLRPTPLAAPAPAATEPPGPSAPPPRAAAEAAQTQAARPRRESAPEPAAAAEDAGANAPPAAAPPAAPAGDEVSAALAGGGDDAPALADEAATLLHLAEDAATREDWEGLRAGLDNYLAHLAAAPRLVQWRARRLQVRLAIHDGDINRALQGFEDLLGTGHRPPAEEVPALLDGLLAGAEPKAAASLRVSMLVRILAVFRQARDQAAMDRCYGWIEEAQEQVGDERRLLQYLKNHLEIRKVLGDLPGQLELIDQLGNRCYRLGLTDDAKTYYEMGLRLRAQAERPAAAAAPAGRGQPDEEAAGEPGRPGGAVHEG